MFAVFASFASAALFLKNEEKSFVSWMRNNNQVFTGDEYQTRLGIWMSNARFVQEHNAKGTFRVTLNKFAAMTPAEYKALLGYKPSIKARNAVKLESQKNIGTLDWREKGAVNGIKDQGSCGSCWAFSTIQGVEGAYFVANNKLYSLSESNLVDCVDTCYGCNGGLMDAALDYVMDEQGGKFMLESDYPYIAAQQACGWVKSKGVASVSKYIYIVEGDENDLCAKCAKYGPVCVAIDAGKTSFQLYSGGIYDESGCSSTALDHGVGCVGYGTEGSTDYWIVRNSWGTVWGEAGYIRMIWKNNQCGIATSACVPVA